MATRSAHSQPCHSRPSSETPVQDALCAFLMANHNYKNHFLAAPTMVNADAVTVRRAQLRSAMGADIVVLWLARGLKVTVEMEREQVSVERVSGERL